MFKRIKPFFIICETPLHAGSGSDLGIVDLPIQRERHTGFPKIEASGLKGSIRASFENIKDVEEDISLSFGPTNGDLHAGALGFTDGRILLFPVKAMKGVFAWVTCPKVLDKFYNDMKLAGVEKVPRISFGNSKKNYICSDSNLLIKDKDNNSKIVLEEYTFDVEISEECNNLSKWISENVFPADNKYRFKKLQKDLVILNDDDFSDFVNFSTEVITRTKINNKTGTVQSGALFTEEYLPTETIMYSMVLASPIFNKDKGIFIETEGKKEEDILIEFFEKQLPEVIQIGGNATIGKGIVTTKVYGR